MPCLGPLLRPCGPVLDTSAAARVREALGARLEVEAAWSALEPVFAASPYLGGLAAREPERLERLLAAPADDSLARLVADARAAAALPAAEAAPALRRAKAELHLLTALADLGGVWDLAKVTGALSRFADAAVQAALAVGAGEERAKGRLLGTEGERGPTAGLFVLALGKHGASELNYSSDIDVSVFYDPDALPVANGAEPQKTALRLTQAMARLLSERTADGYVFRVDLRLRPDPSSTPVAVPVEAALAYYESAGQNWERAAMIKARVCAGDAAAGEAFLEALQPFVWRRALDYAAIADIQAIKSQIHAHKRLEREDAFAAAGADLKLGPGGIREIEFYAQTQQLILGGRFPELRARRTLDALAALAAAGQAPADACADLAAAYPELRAWEHRVQMLADEQTHTLPADAPRRAAVAALAGLDLPAFDAKVEATLGCVNDRYAELFSDAEPLSSPFGSLVFTGVEDDPATLATLGRMGFSAPPTVAATIRAWHHGRIAATRTPRGRELFTRLAPRVLEAAAATGAPDAAFARFAGFFSGLSSGVAIQSLFLNEPAVLDLVIEVLALAPRLGAVLARQPAAIDALLDPGFFEPLDPAAIAEAVRRAVEAASGFEPALDAARRAHREEAFRIGVQALTGRADAVAAGSAFAALADGCVAALSPAALAEVERLGGAFPGEVAVVGLGKLGGREMTAASDLDLMTVHRAAPDAVSATKGWGAETVYARFTQRLTAALASPTAEGRLYEVDLQLRPSGTQGPIAVSLASLEGYYAREAEVWELMALTRARVVWSSSPALARDLDAAIDAALRRPRDPDSLLEAVRDMRALMRRERPASGPWDLKLADGGLVDIEFAAQALQLRHAAHGGPLRANTGDAMEALAAAGLASPEALAALADAWRLQQALQQVLKLAVEDVRDPAAEPQGLHQLLAEAGGAPDFNGVRRRLADAQAAAHAAFSRIVSGDA